MTCGDELQCWVSYTWYQVSAERTVVAEYLGLKTVVVRSRSCRGIKCTAVPYTGTTVYITPRAVVSKLHCLTTKRGCQYRTIRLPNDLGEMFLAPTFLAPTLLHSNCGYIEHGKIGKFAFSWRRPRVPGDVVVCVQCLSDNATQHRYLGLHFNPGNVLMVTKRRHVLTPSTNVPGTRLYIQGASLRGRLPPGFARS